MARYLYRALGSQGTVQTGSCEAASGALLRGALHAQGLQLIWAWRLGIAASLFEAAPSFQAKADFFTHLGTLVGAGFPLEEALSSFTSHKALGRTARHMAAQLRAGKTLGEVFGAQKNLFDPTTLIIIAAAQKNGDLVCAFEELATHWHWVATRRQDTLKALIYPSCLFVLVVALLTFLMDQVVPQLEGFLTMTGHVPTFSARLLHTLCAHAWEGALGVAGFATTLSLVVVLTSRASATLHLFWQRTLRGIPFFGRLWFEGASYEMCHALGLMLGAKVDLMEALLELEKMAPPLVAQKVRAVISLVKRGEPLSQSFEQTGLLPSVESRLLALGEKTGRLDHFVLESARLLGERVKKRTRTFLSMLEPGALLIVGALLIWIVSAVFLPLYEHLVLVEGL